MGEPGVAEGAAAAASLCASLDEVPASACGADAAATGSTAALPTPFLVRRGLTEVRRGADAQVAAVQEQAVQLRPQGAAVSEEWEDAMDQLD